MTARSAGCRNTRTSPAEMERGASYEFVLQHTIAVDDERDLFRTELRKVAPRG